MNMPNDLLYQFAKVVSSKPSSGSETTLFGVITEYNGLKYVKLDGSDLLTPISSTTNIESGERVTVMIKDHSAIVTGNITSPAARTEDVENLKDEIATLLRIESSRGTVFKNDTVSTILSVVIYHGKQRITDSTTMKSVFGDGAYLQWKWLRVDDDTFGIISSSDSRFGKDGFIFSLSPEDVNTKVTFMCELII